MRRLFLWEELEELALSYNYIEGSIPDFTVGRDGVRAYSAEDVREHGDTLNYAVEHELPRILPNMRSLRINLNFMTGRLPDWLLYHPHLMEWGAETLIYTQQEKGIDSMVTRWASTMYPCRRSTTSRHTRCYATAMSLTTQWNREMKRYTILALTLLLCGACVKDVEPNAPDTTPNTTITIPEGANQGEVIIKFSPEMEEILDQTMTRSGARLHARAYPQPMRSWRPSEHTPSSECSP